MKSFGDATDFMFGTENRQDQDGLGCQAARPGGEATGTRQSNNGENIKQE